MRLAVSLVLQAAGQRWRESRRLSWRRLSARRGFRWGQYLGGQQCKWHCAEAL